MLTQLSIRDFAIVDRLDLEFFPGMTVLTGETGAGKSIIVDALGIVLGDRADSGVVRHGHPRAEIIANFDVSQCAAAKKWLKTHELDADGECLLRRTLPSEGASRAYINGRPVALQQLRELADELIDIHSQHQHHSLLRVDEQRQLLDSYADIVPQVQQLGVLYQQWRKIEDEILRLRNAQAERANRLDFLQFQLDELNALQPKQGEWDELTQEQKRLVHQEKIASTIQQSLRALADDRQSILTRLRHMQQDLRESSQYEKQLNNTAQLIDSAYIQLEEAVNDLRAVDLSENNDPRVLADLDKRMGAYHELARKHRCEPEFLVETLRNLQSEFDALQKADETLDTLVAQRQQRWQEYEALAAQVSAMRQKGSHELSKRVTKQLHRLGMPDAEFNVELTALAADAAGAYGKEHVGFMVSTNKGQPLKPLAKVASGGELSRMSLAIQVVTAQVARIPVLVFDEVDVGIGGGVAEIVGELMRSLAKSRQILCVTHQAQVASFGDQHWFVSKRSTGDATSSQIDALDGKQRVNEIARMLGGTVITDATRKHAKEMLLRGQNSAVEA